MRTFLQPKSQRQPGSLRDRLVPFTKDDKGSTAIEFALVAIPFFILVVGLIGISYNFFVQNSLENSMSRTSRLIRTGEAQAADWTINDYKNRICQSALIDCTQFQVFVATSTTWQGVQPISCVNNNGQANVNSTPAGTKIADLAGGASQIVVITGCYRWTLTKDLPLIKLGNLSDGSTMMQTLTAFRAEPYTPPS